MLGSFPLQPTSSMKIGPVPWPKKAKEKACAPVKIEKERKI